MIFNKGVANYFLHGTLQLLTLAFEFWLAYSNDSVHQLHQVITQILQIVLCY